MTCKEFAKCVYFKINRKIGTLENKELKNIKYIKFFSRIVRWDKMKQFFEFLATRIIIFDQKCAMEICANVRVYSVAGKKRNTLSNR